MFSGSKLICFLSSSTFIDTSKMSQESLKKIYSNNILKSITPQYNNAKQQTNPLFSREGIFKTYNNEGFRAETASGVSATLAESNSSASLTGVKSPLSALYQRAQKEVLTHKINQFGNEQNRESTPNGSSQRKHKAGSKPLSNSNVGSMIAASSKRDETPKNVGGRIALGSQNANTYASPEQYTAMNVSSSQNKLSKKNSMKALHGHSPNKRTTTSHGEKAMYMSYEYQANALKKQGFKLDLNNRNQLHR